MPVPLAEAVACVGLVIAPCPEQWGPSQMRNPRFSAERETGGREVIINLYIMSML